MIRVFERLFIVAVFFIKIKNNNKNKIREVTTMGNTFNSALKNLTATPLNLKERKLVRRIKNGFDNQEFKMHLQFIVDCKENKIVSAETLSRWEQGSGEIVFPGAYIGTMEKSGLIISFDYYMFEMVCQKLSSWKDTEFSDISLSCNLTRITISEKDFIEKIKAISEKYDFDRNKLIIEITEDSIEKNLVTAMYNIIKIKEMGFRVALDDFGSGYTSMISLCEYPIDIVKLDRQVLLMAATEKGGKLFSGIISLLHNLKVKVICEGVETEEQKQLVVKGKCDGIQGWYYTKALPEAEAEKFAREYAAK